MTEIPNDNISLDISDFLNTDHQFWTQLLDDNKQNMKNIRDSMKYIKHRPIYIKGNWQQTTFTFENFNIGRNDHEWPTIMCRKLRDYQKAGGKIIGSSLVERQPEKINASTELNIKCETLSEEQQGFVNVIKNHVKQITNSIDNEPKIIMLTGYAGCGKTSVVKSIKLMDNVKLLYMALTQQMCNEIQHKYGIDNTSTFLRLFKKLLNMTTMDVKLMSKVLTRIESGFFLDTKNYQFTQKNMKIDELKELFERGLDNINVIFLDDFNMFTPSQLEFFICGIRKVAELLEVKFIIILAGDFNNISPLYLVPNDNYDKIINLCQSDLYNFKEQHRITDTDYWHVVKLLTEQPLTDATAFLNKLFRVSRPNSSFTSKIIYKYPFELCEEAYGKLKAAQSKNEYKITEWLKEITGDHNDFFSKVLNFNIYAYRNRDNEYNNLALAFDILQQFEDRKKTIDDIAKFMQFSTFNVYNTKLPYPISVTGHNMMPILPLIRFFPYKTLCYVEDIPTKTIVYLIDWHFEKGFVTIFRPDNKVFYKLYNYPFYINSTHAKLHGIPLQLAVSNTFQLSAGLTLTNKLVVSMANIGHKDLYAILTRIPAAEKLHVFFSTGFKEVAAKTINNEAKKVEGVKEEISSESPTADEEATKTPIGNGQAKEPEVVVKKEAAIENPTASGEAFRIENGAGKEVKVAVKKEIDSATPFTAEEAITTVEEVDAVKKEVDSENIEVFAIKKEIALEIPSTAEKAITRVEDVKAIKKEIDFEIPSTAEEAEATENVEVYAAKILKRDGAEAVAATLAAEEYAPATIKDENGVVVFEKAGEVNGFAFETVKRKVTAGDATKLTPEKKIKLAETSKEEVIS